MKNQFVRLLLLGLFISCLNAHATYPQGKDPKNPTRQTIFPLGYYLDTQDTFSLGTIIALYQKGSFQSTTEKNLNLGIPSSSVWLHFQLKSSQGGAYILKLANSRLNKVRLFEWSKTGGNHPMTGDQFPFIQREVFHKNFCFEIYLPSNQPVDYFFYVNQIGSTARMPVEIFTQKAFEESVQSDYFLEGLIYGTLIFVSVFSLFLFINTRHLFYLYYTLYVASGIFWCFGYFGLGFEFLWPKSTWFQMFAAPLFASLNLLLNLQIAESLLIIKGPKNKFKQGCFYFKVLLAGFILFPLVVDLRHASFFVNHSYLLLFLITVITSMAFLIISIVYFITKRSVVAKIYLMASLVKAAGIINLALIELNLGIDVLPIEPILQIGLIIEIALLSYIIARRYTAYKNKTTQAIITAQEQEREGIAKEIHDHILSGLNGIIKSTEGLQYSYSSGKAEPNIGTRLDKLKNALSELYFQTRDVSHYMLPDYIKKHDLTTIAETYIHYLNSAISKNPNVLQIHFTCLGKPRDFSTEARLNIFRILQELIGNILQHSRAQHASVELAFLSRGLQLLVSDDGIGIPGNKIEGIGLLNIKSRVRLLQGQMKIQKAKIGESVNSPEDQEEGAAIKIFIPYYQENYFSKNEY